jgi:hypothetical protein
VGQSKNGLNINYNIHVINRHFAQENEKDTLHFTTFASSSATLLMTLLPWRDLRKPL